jgi:cytochrome d ubiquinol oxidase subunit II
MEWYLPVIWAGLIGVAVAMYVILDGFDLGVGILFPAFRSDRHRDLMVNTVAPFWDGNETWLVLGGGGLWVAFPRAYAVLMPALYIPVILMLLALVFRGVAFEFRTVARASKRWWNLAFWLGSTLAAFFQGVILGGLIQGVRVANGEFAGGPFDWATPFSVLCGLGVVTGYALLGSTWLVMRTEGEVADRARGLARRMLIPAVLAFMAVVSIWTPIANERIAQRWFSLPNILYLWPVPIATALLAWAGVRWLERGREALPFLAAIGLFLLGYLGLVISWFPFLVPPSLTVWDTAAVPASQVFTLIGVVFMLPIILGYIGFVYWLFRGKVREGDGYH